MTEGRRGKSFRIEASRGSHSAGLEISGGDSSSSAPGNLFKAAFQLQEDGRFSEAAGKYVQFLKARPSDPAGYNNLGNCFRSLGEYEKAIPCFLKALELEPNRTSSCLNLSLARLSIGQYSAAWPDYEARLETIPFRRELLKRKDLQWKGEPLAQGQRLYVYGNQGLGDELQCLRFLPEVFGRAHEVILELQEPTMALAQNCPDHVSLIRRGEKVPSFHRWCEIFSLPGILGVDVENIPATDPPEYKRDRAIEELLQQHREAADPKFRIGLVWSGNPGNSLNRFRACELKQLLPLLELDGCQFYSLQKGAPSRELDSLDKADRIVDLGPMLQDFASTATAIGNLDLLITTDTSVPHLAGVLGAEAWVLLHHPADWRWGLKGEASPWYPSLKLFRQKRSEDWVVVVQEVREALQMRLEG